MSHLSAESTAQGKRELLAQLLKKSRDSEARSPLSLGQRALWFVHQLDPSSPAYNILYAARVRADVDRGALQGALQQLNDRHATLRTTYGANEGVPEATIHAHSAIPLEVVEAADWSDAEVQQRIHIEADRPFDLQQGPVIRAHLFTRRDLPQVLLITAAHIATDFWSIDLMLDELSALYRERVTGALAKLRPPKFSFRDFVVWKDEMLAGPEGERLWNYWREHLSGPLSPLDLPTDRPRPPVQTYCGSSRRFDVSEELTRRLIELGKAEGATLYVTLLAAFWVLLYRYSGQSDIIVGSTAAGRNRTEWEETVGYFLTVIPLRCRLEPEMTFRELLAQVRQTVLGGIDHQEYPFPLIVERLAPPRDVSRSPIFQVAFNWDRPRKLVGDAASSAVSGDVGNLGLEPFAIAQQGSAFDLTLVMLHRGDLLSGALQYNSDLFDEATIGRMAGHLVTLLERAASNPSCKLADLPLLTRVERQTLVEDWNDTASEYPRDKCVHELVTEQVDRSPDSIAIVHQQRALTYREMDERSNQLAHYLRRLGVGPDVLVGICVERSLEMVVGLLGILKAGGAYVPLAPDTPADRLAYILEESKAPILLTQRGLADDLARRMDRLSTVGGETVGGETVGGETVAGETVAGETAQPRRVICLDDDWQTIAGEPSSRPTSAAGPEHLAYVIFTSGSTGRPKGVEIENRSVVNFLCSMEKRPGIGPSDRLLAVTTVTFDISGLELFLPLTVGGQVIIASRETTMDGRALAQTVVDCGATVMQATPATWRLLIQAGWRGDGRLKDLCGGEALPRDLADLLLERSGEVWNMYGPTETTIWSSVDRILPAVGPVLIGPPIANTQFYILDDRRQPKPVGVPGELYIGGDGLARGYLNRPDLTAEKFHDDPFHPGPRRRMYQTGDLTRFRPDGRIEFLGRLDHQVKVRGFRIELGEIEAVLSQHDAVREVVVTARQVTNNVDDKQLVAYVVPAGTEMPATSELRGFLKQKLPDHMVPAHFVTLAALPLNPSGKVDRKALPAPDAARPNLAAAYVAPRNELEATLATIWADVLGRDKVGVFDDYFDLGGASLQSLEIAALAEAEQIRLTPALLFQYPTVAELAAVLASRNAQDASIPPPARTGNGHARRNSQALVAPPLGHAAGELRVEDRESIGLEPAPHAEPAVERPQAAPRREPTAAPSTARGNTVIESIGVYLPPNEVTTEEIIRGCRNRIWFPLERMSGIRARRMSRDGDYSVELARKAIEECLAYSKYGPDDIDLVMCCNITRGYDSRRMAVEPNTSLQLKEIFGFPHAVAFDVTNACGGMFTAMSIADAWLQIGAIRRALVVSGEYISGIIDTAQLEIKGFLDPRIACLTVGDAGAAVLLESATGRDVGFHELELYTVSRYNRMCIGRLTEHPHGGAIMHVPDPIKHTSISAEHSVMHAQYMFEKSPWPPDKIQHLIIHQTSRRSLRDGMRAINKAFRRKVSREDNTIDNLSERGNTASTTHMVALWDHILAGRIKSGDRTVFAVSGSGQTIGTGLYTLDDLPDRLRNFKQRGIRPAKADVRRDGVRPPGGLRVAVTSLGTARASDGVKSDSTALAVAAAEECLKRWGRDRNEIGLLLFTGMTHSEYISEPAIATFVAGELKINDCIESGHDRKTLAFDIYNTSMAFLNACEVASGMIQAGKYKVAMVATSEVELQAEHFPSHPLGLAEAGSAIILEAASDARRGFGSFVFRYATQHRKARTITGRYRDEKPFFDVEIQPDLEDRYLELAQPAVEELLAREGLTRSQIRVLLPSQFSSAFNARLAQTLGIPLDRMVDLGAGQHDYFTNSLPFSLRHALEQFRVQPGDVGLIVNVASGLQVGCAIYYF